MTDQTFTREVRLADISVRADGRVAASLSSTEPVDRFFGTEVLEHSKDAVDLSRAPLPLLDAHDPSAQVGVVESVRVVGNKLRGLIRFASHPRAVELADMVRDKIATGVSIGYRVLKMAAPDADGVHRVTRWQPLEASLVPVPADATVGVGRSLTRITRMHDNDQHDDDTLDTGVIPLSRGQRRAAARGEDAERKRIASIEASVKLYPQLREVADRCISEGLSVETFRARAMPLLGNRPEPTRDRPLDELPRPGTPASYLGLTGREVESFSILRALEAQLQVRERGGKLADYAPFEAECSREIAKRLGRDAKGVLVPFEVTASGRGRPVGWSTRVSPPMNTTDQTHLVGTDHLADQFIDALRASSVVLSAGATVLQGLTGNVSIPKKAAPTGFSWLAEADAIAPDDFTTASVTLSPTTVAGALEATRRLVKQSSPDAEMLMRNDLVTGIAVEMDRAALVGDGTGNLPVGILNQADVLTVTVADFAAGAGIPTWAETVEFETVVKEANALLGTGAYVTTPTVSGGMKTAVKDAGSGQFVQEGGMANGYTVATTSHITAKTILFGDFAQCLVGFWGVIDLLVDQFTRASSGGLIIWCYQDLDVAVRHGQSFAKSA